MGQLEERLWSHQSVTVSSWGSNLPGPGAQGSSLARSFSQAQALRASARLLKLEGDMHVWAIAQAL